MKAKLILQRANLPDNRFHDLRHSFAVTSLYAGDDIKTVQTNLGHATAQFTLDTYGHVTQKMRQDSANRMQQFYEQLSKKRAIRGNFPLDVDFQITQWSKVPINAENSQ